MHVPSVQSALVQSRYGDASEVLTFTDSYPVTPPGATEVQIQVHAASINPIDWQMIEGNRKLIARRSFPFVPLFNLAGVVSNVGEKVTRFRVGDAVHADNQVRGGGASQFANVREEFVSLKPESVNFAEAAAIPLAGQTALLALEKGGVGVGSRVCIIGASGGVGSFAVQMAKALGAAHVAGVCSGKNREFVMSLGADQVIDYTQARPREVLGDRSMEVVVDCVGGREQWMEAKKILVPGGRFVTISRDEDGKVTVRGAVSLIVTIRGRQLASRFGEKIRYIPVFLDASQALLGRVDALVAAGKVKIPIGRRYGFRPEGMIEMIEESKRGRMVGKSVMEIVGGSEGPM